VASGLPYPNGIAFGDCRVFPLHCGSLRVSQTHAEAQPGWGRMQRLTRTLLDTRWTEPVPAWAWLIEHPEGDWLVDTGQAFPFPSPAMRRADPLGARINHWLVRQEAPDGDAPEHGPPAVDRLLRQLQRDPEAPISVLLTHLHVDHVDGLQYLPRAEVQVHAECLRRSFGAATRHLGPAFRPKALEAGSSPFKAFPKAMPISARGDLWLIPTPGHTPGHSSVLLRTTEADLFFAGDMTFTESQLERGRWPGIADNRQLNAHTMRRVRRHARLFPTVYLPSHDPQSADRLARVRHLQAHRWGGQAVPDPDSP
jgi:glyoxylase-like metal-dependent hydrolase (beta-lactamase superfamily II)